MSRAPRKAAAERGQPVLSIRGVTRTYKTGARELEVLKGVDLDVYPGEVVGLIGPSGSGKSSLLHAAGLLEHPTTGEIAIDGEAVGKLPERARTRIRRALANQPHLLLADEPTGNLDPATSQTVFEALHRLVKDTGVAALIATHNMELAGHMDRVFAIKDGHLEERPAESHAY